MSGCGKSSALAELSKLGFQVLDTDEPGWTEWSESEGGYLWREDRIADRLAGEAGPSLYVSGTVSNQGRFYSRFDEIVLLSAPAEVLLGRIEARTTNPYGKTPEQRDLVLRDLAESNHCYAEPARSRSTPHDLSSALSTSSQSSAANLAVPLSGRSPGAETAALSPGEGIWCWLPLCVTPGPEQKSTECPRGWGMLGGVYLTYCSSASRAISLTDLPSRSARACARCCSWRVIRKFTRGEAPAWPSSDRRPIRFADVSS